MSDKGLKDLRKQLRSVVKEELPGVLTLELIKEQHAQLKKEVAERLDAIDKHLRAVLDSVEQRSKDTTSYILRSVKVAPPPPKAEQGEVAKSE